MRKNSTLLESKILFSVFIICTLAILVVIYKNIDNTFTYNLAKWYIALLYLVLSYLIIALVIGIRKSRWSRVRKLLLKFIIYSFALWAGVVIAGYLAKGELRLTERIVSSICIAFGTTFGGLIFKNRNDK